ncbi:MAG: nucleotidyltransferase [Acidobacteriia bacterium]|nr:nucleotidyltransferase [Terriglobia bacterium]
MGGGGGSSYTGWQPERLKDILREKSEQSAVEFEGELAGYLAGLLAEFNSRDTDLINERLETAKAALEDRLEGSFDQLFGGSVAKHTYVDGLSDIDSLLIINGSDLAEGSPRQALRKIEKILSEKLGNDVTATHGRMAVTLEYADGMQIQLLPAIHSETGLRIPSSRRDAWSKVNPDVFRSDLTQTNAQCGGKLVPTIKLAKAIIANLPESQQLSGYHVENLGIGIFRGYEGKKTTAAMLPVFFERAKELVLTPIRDKTGQSVHVDGYLGEADSPARQNASHLLGGIAKRMRSASTAASKEQWAAIFDEEN